MRFFCLAMSAMLVLAFSSSDAVAGPKPWVFGWWPGHWNNLNFESPYMYDGKTPHNTQWDKEDWKPQDWIVQRGSGVGLIESWYLSGIIQDQYMRYDVPVLEVGPAFYDLGGFDKRRIMQTVDAVYRITSRKENGMFRLRDGESGDFIGLYSSHGLMLQ